MNSSNAENDRRSVYRVRPASNEELALAIQTADGEVAAEQVVDITIKGAATRFPRWHTPAVKAGNKVKLLVRSPALGTCASVEATVIKGVEMESEWRYNFSFEHADEVLQQAPKEIFRLFNRRSEPRDIQPAAA